MSDDANRQGFLSLKAGDKDDDLNKVVSKSYFVAKSLLYT